MSRLPTGGLIDRSQPLAFTFDGRSYSGYAGDTLASALLAAGVRLVGRSFKYHRPRGVLSAGPEEPNALVTLGSGAHAEPNVRATTLALYEGLEATSQNRWPSLAFDLLGINQAFAPWLVAGFYYKTFMWPRRFWETIYEPLIRRCAGLGRLSGLPDPQTYDREHHFCDVLVIGGGPAGLAAALAAGRSGLRVVLADQGERFGGRLLAERHIVDGQSGAAWAGAVTAELSAMPNVRLLPRTLIFGAFDGGEYGGAERLVRLSLQSRDEPAERFWKIIARQAILATGAIERPLVFGGNDRPGVMMASAVSTYINRFAVAPGRRAVVFTTSDSGWQTAGDLLSAGVKVVAIVEARPTAPAHVSGTVDGNVPVYLGARVTDARGAPLRVVDIDTGDRSIRVEADLLAVAGGWSPAIGLGSNLGHRPQWSDTLNCFLLDGTPPGLSPAGAAAGEFSLDAALQDGTAKASAALRNLGNDIPVAAGPRGGDDWAGVTPLWHVPGARTKAFVDFQNDVTDTDIALSAREGFVSVEHLKRYTTLGMATDQGKTGQLNGHALLALATGRSIAEVGTIVSRSPYHPVPIGLLAGRHRDGHFRPERRTATHEWAVEQGAAFLDAGLWKRARWFPQSGDSDWRDSVNREVQATRTSVGICDVSTLGKIELHGPDVGTLLDRLYVNTFSTLGVGRARYGVMLREDGIVLDDGTTTRFAEDRYFMTTTTANAARVMQHVDFARQVLWPELDVQAISVTEQWSTFSVAGPRSRALLQQLLPQLDLSNDAFPYMAAAESSWGDVPVRLCRLSFSGELAFEVSVPCRRGDELLRKLFRIGASFGACPYGVEALAVMRIEKGHVAGPELNGQTTAGDLGLGRMMSTKKDYIGRALASRPGLIDAARPRLVGLKTILRTDPLPAGAHLARAGASISPATDEGYVTSTAYSPTLAHPIGLALLTHGPERVGEEMFAHDPVRGKSVRVRVCDPVFVDPEGVRLRG